jgi:hypothetical protein
MNDLTLLSCGSRISADKANQEGIRGQSISFTLMNVNVTFCYAAYAGCSVATWEGQGKFDGRYLTVAKSTGACHLLNPTGSSATPTIRDSNFYQNTVLTFNGGQQGAVLCGTSSGMTIDNC